MSLLQPSEDGDEAASAYSSGSGFQSSPHPQSEPAQRQGRRSPTSDSSKPDKNAKYIELAVLIKELTQQHVGLHDEMQAIKTQMEEEARFFKQVIEEERYRSKVLEEQINDLSELHQHEVTNIKQELQSMEEKMEYQLEERTRDMQELLGTCQTRITKMELAQQQQQLISMETIENSNFRNLITKMINVVLAVLAVVLVFVSTIANILGPLIYTRHRLVSSVIIITALILTWQNWNELTEKISNYMYSFFDQS